MNPFKSRSTIICTEAFITLIVVVCVMWKAGFMDAVVGMFCLTTCKDIMMALLKHQEASDEMASSTTATITTPTTPEVKKP